MIYVGIGILVLVVIVLPIWWLWYFGRACRHDIEHLSENVRKK